MFIDRVQLFTSNPPAIREFYRSILELGILSDDNEGLEIQAGATLLAFQRGPAAAVGVYHIAFNVPENRFQDAKQWLLERLPLVPNGEGGDEFRFESWNADAVYFYDPDGNILEFIARHDLDNASDAAFDSSQILRISEIGLVTDDVPVLVSALQSKMDVRPYRTGSDTFAPIGDENGLFIVVKTGRPWFASFDQSAVIVPLEVMVRNAREEAFTVTSPDYRIAPQG